MTEKVFIKSEQGFEPVELKDFTDEKELERIIIENPNLLPIDEISPNLELIAVSSQFQTNHGPLDILGIDQTGTIYIIETKLDKNPDRKKIIGQVIDYAGGLFSFKDDFEIFKEKILKANQSDVNKGTKLENKSLEELLVNFSDEDDILSLIEKNFKNGSFSYIFVLDEVDQRIKDNIKYYNQTTSNVSMYAVTISNFIPEGTTQNIVVTSIYGTETAKTSDSQKNYQRWLEEGEEVFYKNLNANTELSQNEKQVVKSFINDLKELLGSEPNSDETYIGYYDWGNGKNPRFFARVYELRTSANWSSRAAFNIDEDGSIRFRFSTKNEKLKEFTEKFVHELKQISCSKNLIGQIESGSKKPLWSVHDWTNCKNDFLQIIKKLFQPVKE